MVKRLPVCTGLMIVAASLSVQQGRATQLSMPTSMRVFQEVEDRWSEAINKRDQHALDLVLSPEFIDISASGAVRTRNLQVASIFPRGTDPLSLDRRVLSVRIFGDMAVVIGTYYVEERGPNENPVRRNGMFTHIYRSVRGKWLCVNAHSTATLDPGAQMARGAKKQKDTGHLKDSARQSTQ
jgi:ketosteroid isomerase-like protein